MTLRTACSVAALLSVACGCVASAQATGKPEAPTMLVNKGVRGDEGTAKKTAVGRCAPTFDRREAALTPEVLRYLETPLVASNSGLVRRYTFYNSRIDSRSVVECQYKSVDLPSDYQGFINFYCKNAVKKSEDTWVCER